MLTKRTTRATTPPRGAPRPGPRPRPRHGLRPALLAGLALAASACSGIIELEAADPVEFVVQPQTSDVYAADGALLVELHGEQDRRDVALDAVAPVLAQAVVAIEDRRFFLHVGVDLPAIGRALVRNIESGEIDQGGSTLTQQYVKNTMTGNAQSLDRKLKEASLAFQLEQRYSKAEILERYLNTVYFGQGAYGADAAAGRFFGIEAAELTLDQASLLAGLIASPSRFDPYNNPESAAARRRLVLDAMVETGQIGREDADAAAAAVIELHPPPAEERVDAPYFIDEVKRLLQHDPDGEFAEALGATLDERVDALFTGGLRITTTLDPVWQAQADAAVNGILDQDGDPSAAVVAVDPATGAVRALVGGRDYYDTEDPQARFNLATQAQRQPGSSFKPIALASALQRGVPLDRTFPGGACVTFTRPAWAPCNYDQTAYGPLTLREATVRSVNTVYARLAVELGPDVLKEQAVNLGFSADLPAVHALALGAGEVRPIEMAGAYASFAALGEARTPYLIERIEAADGRVLYEHATSHDRVLDEAVAYLITQTLTDVVRRGTGVRAQIGRPQAGKTGTSQDNADAWFIGYTPDLVAAVWVGFPAGRTAMRPPATRQVVEGGRWPAEIWKAFAEKALVDLPARPFDVPDLDLSLTEVDVSRNCLPNPYTPPELIERREYLPGTAPTERCKEPTGPPIDDVPNVTGLPAEIAQRLLTDLGFVVDARPEASKLYPPGIVTRQRPDVGGTTLASDGNAVVLWISTSVKARASIPSVVGLRIADAVRALESQGWVAEWRNVCPPEGCPEGFASGEVYSQSPGAGEIDREHTAIVMRVVP